MRHPFLALSTLTAALLFATSCGPEGPASSEVLPLELPVVAECGSIPEGRWVVTVQVTKDGDVHVPGFGGPLSMRRLQRHLAEMRRERGPASRAPDRENAIDVVLEVDASVPWRFVAWMMEGLRDVFIRVRHVWFTVRHAGDAEKGAVAYVWSGLFGIDTTRFIEDGVSLRVHLRPAAGHTDLRGLYDRTRRIDDDTLEKAIVEIRPPKDDASIVSWGDVLGVLDALRGAGAGRLADLPYDGFDATVWASSGPWGQDLPEEAVLEAQRRWVREHRRAHRGATIVVNGETIPTAPTARSRPPVPRHVGPWGWMGDNVEWDWFNEYLEPADDTEVLEEPVVHDR